LICGTHTHCTCSTKRSSCILCCQLLSQSSRRG
jgi:hypothetical protein